MKGTKEPLKEKLLLFHNLRLANTDMTAQDLTAYKSGVFPLTAYSQLEGKEEAGILKSTRQGTPQALELEH